MRPRIRLGIAVACLVATIGCSGRALSPAGPAPQFQSVRVDLKILAGQKFSALALSAYRDGAAAPAAPSVVGDVTGESNSQCERSLAPGLAAARSNIARICSVVVTAPVGLDDFALTVYDRGPSRGRASGHVVARASVLRQSVTSSESATFGVAFGEIATEWKISPPILNAAADRAPHQVPFAVIPADAQGFYVLSGDAPAPRVTTEGAPQGATSVAAESNEATAYALAYDGEPLGDVKLIARTSTMKAGYADFTPLVFSPTSLTLASSETGRIAVSQALSVGPFAASVTNGKCAVVPANAIAERPGEPVTFLVSGPASGACTVSLAGPDSAPSAAAPVPIVYGHGTAGIAIGPSKIKHVVFVIQENRSFDNIFGGLDSNSKPFPGADTVSNPNPGEPTPSDHKGNPVTMSTGALEECYDPIHARPNAVREENGGKMNGFDLEQVVKESCAPSPAPTDYVYRYIEYSEVQPYWQMGEQYAISDRMFESITTGSFAAHLFFVAAQTDHTIDNPNGGAPGGWGCDSSVGTVVDVYRDKTGGEFPGVYPCFDIPTLADLLDQRSVPWHHYAAAGGSGYDFGYLWSMYDAIDQIRNGPDWAADVINPPAQFVTDVGKNGLLEPMTWITPLNASSDHPQSASNGGPAWVTSVVNAVGTSQFWDSTAIFVVWDDWGGWYDHVPPPVTGPVGLGLRVPFIIVSPYAKPGYVSHTVHSFGSMLHFTEEVLNLPSLGQEDASDDDLMDAFNFSQTPIPFQTFAPVGHLRTHGELRRLPPRSVEEGD